MYVCVFLADLAGTSAPPLARLRAGLGYVVVAVVAPQLALRRGTGLLD